VAYVDTLNCVAQSLSLGGTALAAWQAMRASNLLKGAAILREQQEPEPPAATTTPGENGEEIPLERAFVVTADALDKAATGWSTWNHRLLFIGIAMALLGGVLSTYRAFYP
jgi:hypothetical protein